MREVNDKQCQEMFGKLGRNEKNPLPRNTAVGARVENAAFFVLI